MVRPDRPPRLRTAALQSTAGDEPELNCSQCDRSIGNNGGIFLRRGRLVISGDVHPRVSIYVQPDYGTDAAGTQHYLQIRDAYFDLSLDTKKEHRLRIGQSKVPFGFENLQSSQNRLPLDRNDALNSAVPNERDMGVFYYWASTKARQRFKLLVDSGFKGTGDYGVVGLGVMNGQTANRPEANNSLHTVMRVSYPWRLANGQFVEAGISGYNGRFVLPAKSANVRRSPSIRMIESPPPLPGTRNHSALSPNTTGERAPSSSQRRAPLTTGRYRAASSRPCTAGVPTDR